MKSTPRKKLGRGESQKGEDKRWIRSEMEKVRREKMQVDEFVSLCCVMAPVRRATKILESSRATCSLYLPIWHGLGHALKSKVFRMPPELEEMVETAEEKTSSILSSILSLP